MNPRIVITGIATLAFACIPTLEAALTLSPFLRPNVAYVSPDTDGYSDEAYIGVTGGVTFDAKQQHEVSLEVGTIRWDNSENLGVSRIDSDESYIPFLAGYRYYVQPVDSKVRFFAGPSIGIAQADYNVTLYNRGAPIAGDDSNEMLFTYAFNIGASIKLNDNISIDLGYRYLVMADTQTEILGTIIDVDEFKTHALTLGANIRF
jgi:opacity protein-like surface antigen